MKILCYGPFIDYEIQLSNTLSDHHDVTVALPLNDIPEEHFKTIKSNVRLFVIGKHYSKFNPISILNFIKYIKAFNPDVIHVQKGASSGGILDLLFLFLIFIKYPLVTTFHDIKPHEGEESISGFVVGYLFRKFSDEIFVHGNILRDQLITLYKLPEEKVHSIPIGEHNVEPFKIYENPNLSEDNNNILFFGRIYKYKGLDYLIRAEPLMSKELPNIKIVIAGSGEDFKKYADLMIDKNNFLVYNHRISFEEGAELFQKCSVVVLPYIEASQSGVISTAYGFKKPVIVTNVGAMPEIVDNGKTGLIIPPKDHKAIADAIIKLLTNDSQRKLMGENAYKKLKTDMSWDLIADKTKQIYIEAIKHKRK